MFLYFLVNCNGWCTQHQSLGDRQLIQKRIKVIVFMKVKDTLICLIWQNTTRMQHMQLYGVQF